VKRRNDDVSGVDPCDVALVDVVSLKEDLTCSTNRIAE
jgi:hypothetical protein